MRKLTGNHLTELHAVSKYRNGEALMTHNRFHLDPRAEFALAMIDKWGMVAARPGKDGEMVMDRGLALMSVDEVVARACRLAETAFDAFQAKGWMLDVPPLEEALHDQDD